VARTRALRVVSGSDGVAQALSVPRFPAEGGEGAGQEAGGNVRELRAAVERAVLGIVPEPQPRLQAPDAVTLDTAEPCRAATFMSYRARRFDVAPHQRAG
jgi:hypothetical protein